MKRNLKAMILMLVAALVACAQSGSITRTTMTVITATAVNGPSTMVCVFNNAAAPVLHAECKVNGTVRFTSDVDVKVGSAIGSVGAYVEAGNNITWIFTQPTANNFHYEVAANGQSDQGNF